MPKQAKVKGSSKIEEQLQFFLHEFCPSFMEMLYDRRRRGIGKAKQDIIKRYLISVRGRAATVGDSWWYNYVRLETSIHKRVRKIYNLFVDWTSVPGSAEARSRSRARIEDKIANHVGRLSKTCRHNLIILRDVEEAQLQADIKYVDELRKLGVPILTEAVSKAVVDIFNSRPRGGQSG